ncbi:MAG: hypothetical protein EOO20_15905 [Chryseobacterium sp.]|nr:MAG: hypothetical protein EOO20_15905 [Chryseobacterium sp.]
MGGRPPKIFKPLEGNVDRGYTPSTQELLDVIVKKAVANEQWIFIPDSKRWFSPEEFMEVHSRYDNLPIAWIEALQVMDPEEGLIAADQQIESILSRKAAFSKKIIEYWKARKSNKS